MLIVGGECALGSQPFNDRQVVVTLNPGSDLATVLDRWDMTLVAQSGGSVFLLSSVSSDVPGLVMAMAQDPDIEDVEPNYRMESPEAVRQMILAVVGGTWAEYEDQSATARLGLEEAHEISRGSGVTVAILDTGLDLDHPALVGRVSSAGFDFIDEDTTPEEVADGIDQDGDGEFDEGFGHGTMIAGLVSLIAPDAVLLPVRVLDSEGRGDAFTIVRGLHYALEHGAQVVNLSFGAAQVVTILREEVERMTAAGVIMIGAAGNDDRPGPTFSPADLPGVVMVTALDELDVKAEFADYHNKVTVSAPGVGLRSAYPGGGWALGSGCSFANALVSGSAALVRGAFPSIPKSEVDARLEMGTMAIDDIPGNEPYAQRLGSGRIDLVRMLGSSTGVEATPHLDVKLDLYPNPTYGAVVFGLPVESQQQRLRIVDASGRLVLSRTVPGNGPFAWDGRDAGGAPVPAGSYVVQFGDARGRVTILR